MAHHLDDDLETALMQLTKHRILFHYGILSHNKIKHLIIDRPLLKISTKKDLVNYCHFHHLLFGVDETNYDCKYFRNQIRLLLANHEDVRQQLLILIKQLNDALASQYRKSLLYFFK